MVESDSRLSAEEDRERASSYCSCSSSSKLSLTGIMQRVTHDVLSGLRPQWLTHWTLAGTKGLAIHMRTTSISDASEMQCDSHPRNKQYVAVYHRLSRAYQPSSSYLMKHQCRQAHREFYSHANQKLSVEKWYIFPHRVMSLTRPFKVRSIDFPNPSNPII